MSRSIRFVVILAFAVALTNCPTTPKPPVQTVAAPAFSPVEGTYTSAQSVALASSTDGAAIYYTTDGSMPSATNGKAYSAPISVSATTTIRAIATLKAWNDSPVATATYTITGKVSDVQASPAAGTYTTAQTVSLSTATDGASITYTTDGTDPTASNGTQYSAPIAVSSSTVIKAIATKTGWDSSAVMSSAYTITGKVEKVQFNPEPGDFSAAVSVSLDTATSGATIYYTTDGSDPSPTHGTAYTGAIQVPATVTLKAMASLKDWEDSDITSGTYTVTIAQVVAPPEKPQVAPITQGEIDAARGALARAKEAGADYYDPGNYDAARRQLDDGIALRTRDPATARDRLTSAIQTANLAFDNSVSRAAADLGARMQAARQRLLDIQADKYLPDDYQRATGLIDDAQSLYANNDLAGARAKAYDALREMTNLRNSLATRLTKLRSLKTEVEDVMKQAEEAQAGTYAPDQRQKLNTLYLQGLSAYQGYQMDSAEESFGAALQAGRDAVSLAKQNRDAAQASERQKAEEKQNEVMKALTDASKLTVVTEDGTVHKPQNWSEDDFLKEIDQMIQQEQQNAAPGNQSMVIPSDGSTAVLADDQQVDLLQQARDLWAQGVKAKAAGNYSQAQDYFNEALRYINVYKSYAVKGVYTVRLIPDRRDCLWRIAEYKDIYGDPYLWPVIWRRNRKLIQNPDLIYPGWQLVIPPQ